MAWENPQALPDNLCYSIGERLGCSRHRVNKNASPLASCSWNFQWRVTHFLIRICQTLKGAIRYLKTQNYMVILILKSGSKTLG